MIAADLVTTLTTALSGRLYPSVAPAGVTAPYAVYQLVSGIPVSDLLGQSDRTNSHYQIDLFGRDKSALDTLADAVKSAMDAATLFKSICTLQQDTYEDPAQFYRVSLDFSIWH
jgi:hypothetical protein